MKPHEIIAFLVVVIGVFGRGLDARATGSATDITGLYFTGQNSSGGLQSGGGRDAHWDVTYAFVSGTVYSGSSTYTSSAGAYVLSSTANSGGTANYIDSAYVPNTSSAQWITAPGASLTTGGGSTNQGGDFLPGNGTTNGRISGTTYNNSAFYVYQLAFTISGTGSGVATNQISINLTIASDDAYAIYVTPTALTVSSSTAGNGVVTPTINSTYAASASGTNAWTNTTAQTLANYTDSANGITNNTTFNIGTNYLTIVVYNTNSQTGTNTSSALNPSGLLVYQVGALATIDGRVVPEVGTWLPLLGAVGLYGLFTMRRRMPEDI